MHWMKVNKSQLNLDKMEVLWISRRADLGLEMSPVWNGGLFYIP